MLGNENMSLGRNVPEQVLDEFQNFLGIAFLIFLLCDVHNVVQTDV